MKTREISRAREIVIKAVLGQIGVIRVGSLFYSAQVASHKLRIMSTDGEDLREYDLSDRGLGEAERSLEFLLCIDDISKVDQ
jgi:hypothetical protein